MYWENMDFSRRLASYEGSRPYTPLDLMWNSMDAISSSKIILGTPYFEETLFIRTCWRFVIQAQVCYLIVAMNPWFFDSRSWECLRVGSG